MAEQSTSRRQLVKTSTLGVGIVLAALLLAFANYFGWKYHKRFDWTETELYSLSEKTRNVVRGLEQDIEIVAFASPSAPLADELDEILTRYEALSPRLSVRTVDPLRNLAEAEQLLQELGTRYVEGSVKVVVKSGEDRRILEEDDLAEMDFSSMQFGGAPQVASFNAEEVITGALVELGSGERPKVLFTTGHGEKAIDDLQGGGFQGVQELMGRDNVEFESWSSLGKSEVPPGTSLVVVAGPRAAFTPPELDAFDAYLAAGGRMLWLLDPVLRGDGGLVDLGVADWLAGYGVEVGEDVVIDPDRAVPFFGAETIFVDSYGEHPTVEALSQSATPVIFSLARSVRPGDAAEGYNLTRLAETGADGWGETNLAGLPQVEADDADTQGPVSLAVAVEREADGGTESGEEDAGEEGEEDAGEEGGEAATDEDVPAPAMRLVVIGDSDFGADRLLGSAGNAFLLDNTFNWLLARETLLGIPPKKPEQVRLTLEPQQLYTIYAVTAALPLGAIAAGVVIWVRRRR